MDALIRNICGLAQLRHTVVPDALFDDDCPYFSSYSQTLVGDPLINAAQALRCFVPGVELEIVAPSHIAADRLDYLPPWNYHEEIMRQRAAFLVTDGRLIVPIPESVILDVAGNTVGRSMAALVAATAEA